MQSYEIGTTLGWDTPPWLFKKRVFRLPNRILPQLRPRTCLLRSAAHAAAVDGAEVGTTPATATI